MRFIFSALLATALALPVLAQPPRVGEERERERQLRGDRPKDNPDVERLMNRVKELEKQLAEAKDKKEEKKPEGDRKPEEKKPEGRKPDGDRKPDVQPQFNGGGLVGGGGTRGGMNSDSSFDRLLQSYGGSGDTLDYSKVPADARQRMDTIAKMTGGEPMPTSGSISRQQFMKDFDSRMQAMQARVGRGPNGPPNGPMQPEGGNPFNPAGGPPREGRTGGGFGGGVMMSGGPGGGGMGMFPGMDALTREEQEVFQKLMAKMRGAQQKPGKPNVEERLERLENMMQKLMKKLDR